MRKGRLVVGVFVLSFLLSIFSLLVIPAGNSVGSFALAMDCNWTSAEFYCPDPKYSKTRCMLGGEESCKATYCNQAN